MASSPGPPPLEHNEPQGRFSHCSAIVDGKQYTYGGHCGAGGSPTLTAVHVFNNVTELWQETPTSGEPPPGFMGASCASISPNIYHFGGTGSGGYHNTIHQFDTRVLRWNPVTTTNPKEAPMTKGDAGIISYREKLLVISGGYGELTDQSLPGREYVPDPDREGEGYTNEVHCFHVDSSELY